MRNRLIITFVLFFVAQFTYAQSELRLPEKAPEIAKEKYVLLSDHYDNHEYKESYECFLWIMENAPDMHESAYIIGQKSIKKLLGKNPSNIEYKKKLMKSYDFRLTYFGNEVKVMNRKAFDAYKYFRSDLDFLAETIEIFDKLYEKEKNNLKENLLYPYFDLKVIQQKNELINDEELIKAYEKISEIITHKLEVGENENLVKVQKLIDAKLADSVPLDCERIDQLFVKNDREQLKLQQAKLILKLSLAYECTQETYFIMAIKVLFDAEPKIKLARIIVSYHLDKKEYNQAIEYFNTSLGLTQEKSEKSMIYSDLASVYLSKDDKISARKMAYKSLALDPSNLSNYKLIGDMYYNSYDDCKKGKSRIEDRSVFYAAYEKYALAGNPVKMELAEQQFPSMESIHTENFEEGQIINTNCWVGENVKIRRRPSLVSR